MAALDDLLDLPGLARHAPAAKLRLTTRLPRAPGVYVLRDAQGTVLRVEPAADVRRAVRALFAADPGPGVRHLLRTVHARRSRALRVAGRGRGARGRAGGDAAAAPPPASPSARGGGSTLRVVLTAFVLIHAAPDRIADLGPEIADVDGVAEVYSVTGDLDLVAIVRVREHERLADVVTRHISSSTGSCTPRR